MRGSLRNQRKGRPYTVNLGKLSTLPLEELSNYLHDESMMNQKELQVERTAFSNCTEQLDLVLFETHTEILENVQKRYQNRHCSWDNGTSPFYLGWILLNGKNSTNPIASTVASPFKSSAIIKMPTPEAETGGPQGNATQQKRKGGRKAISALVMS